MRLPRHIIRIVSAAALLVANVFVHAQTPVGVPYLYVPLPYAPGFALPCYPYCGIAPPNRVQERRRERANALKADRPATGTNDFPLPGTRGRAAEPAPESELQPAYRATGKVLPQYDRSGKALPAYAEAVPETTAPAAQPAVPLPPVPKRRAQHMVPCPRAAAEC